MNKMVHFRLNETDYSIEIHEESLALDWIRNVAGLKGTKEGCREGDCGACLVMMGGDGPEGEIEWRSVTSCTLALGELDGRHIITIEGLASLGLTPVMQALLDEGASQCGFCSPGFVLALTNYLVTGTHIDPVSAMVAVEGNLCRCTGYGSIRRAAARLAHDYENMSSIFEERIDFLASCHVLPPALANLMKKAPMSSGVSEFSSVDDEKTPTVIGGGTDYFVRNPDPQPGFIPLFSDHEPDARHIRKIVRNGSSFIEMGSSVTVSDFFAAPLVAEAVPGIGSFAKDVASPPIRNRATLAGNIVNASPIADMTAMLIALGARIILSKNKNDFREIAVEEFFLGYKKIALSDGERIERIIFPALPVLFNFEKVAKRARLDIASVNTAMAVRMSADGTISSARYSAGGIASVPSRIKEIELLITGHKPDAQLARQAGQLAYEYGTPMSDVRGSSEYRKHLMERLVWAHCMRLWPDLHLEEDLLS